MPGGFPLGFEVCGVQDIGSNLGASSGTTLTAPGANNTKGSWTQLIASTAADICFVFINIDAGNGNAPMFNLIDIGVGAGGSELAVCNNLYIGVPGASGGGTTISYCFPLSIPAGTRVSARYQTNDVTVSFPNVAVRITAFDGAFTNIEGAAGVDMLGISTTTSLATAVTPNASANTKGSYAQLIASTTKDYMGIAPMADGTQVGGAYLIDTAIGAGGSEFDIIQNMMERNPGGIPIGFAGIFFPIPIPSGSRLSSRCQFKQAGAAAANVAVAGVFQ